MPSAVYAHGVGADEPLLRLTGATNSPGATQTAYLQDGLGSVVGTANSAGTLTASQRFDAWGNKLSGSGTTPTYGFTGREPDQTGLTYFRARYYHAGVGRFLSRDPAGMADAVSPYAYVRNNPVNLVDPMGWVASDPVATAGTAGQGRYWGDNQILTDWEQPACGAGSQCVQLAAGLAVPGRAAAAPVPGTPGYQGIQQKPDLGGYEAATGLATGTPPSVAGQLQRVLDFVLDQPRQFVENVGNLIFNEAKPPQNLEPITNPPQAPVIPSNWESKPGRVPGSEIFYPPGGNPATGEHIRVMPPGSSAVPGNENGYWLWINGNKQPMDPSTGKPGRGRGDTHIPLPPDSMPPPRR